MPTIYVIIGLPACGKTTFAERYHSDYAIIDDPKTPFDIPRGMEKSFVVISPMFCLDNARQTLDKYLHEHYKGWKIDRIWFQNDPEKCKRNVARRDDGRNVEHAIDILSKKYHPPEDALEIYDGNEIHYDQIGAWEGSGLVLGDSVA